MWPYCEFRMQAWSVLHAARWNTGRKNRQKVAKNRHLRTITQFCRVFATMACIDNQKNVKQQYLLQTPRNMVNLGPLAAEIGSGVWGTPANFNGFLVFVTATTSLNWGEPNFARCLAVSWEAGLVHYIYIFGGTCPPTEFCHVQYSLCVGLAFSYIGSVTARHSSCGRQPKFAEWYKEYRTFAEGNTYIRPGSHHVGHRPTF